MLIASLVLCAAAHLPLSGPMSPGVQVSMDQIRILEVVVDPWLPPPGRYYQAFYPSGSVLSQMMAVAEYLRDESRFLEVCPNCSKQEAETFLRFASGHYYTRFWDAYGPSVNAKRRARAVYREWLAAIGA